MNIDPSTRKLLDNETTIHEAQIRALFQTLDRKFGLRGASVPIRFGYDEAVLGSYTPASAHEKEGFYFSLLFIGYAVKKPLSKEAWIFINMNTLIVCNIIRKSQPSTTGRPGSTGAPGNTAVLLWAPRLHPIIGSEKAF